eukprot:539801_1
MTSFLLTMVGLCFYVMVNDIAAEFIKPNLLEENTNCMTTDIRKAITGTISSWYYANIDGVMGGDTINEFNKNINKIFRCDRPLDICIGTNSDNDECQVGPYKNCGQIKDSEYGYWASFKDDIKGINFGQIDFECLRNDNIAARLTKTTYGGTGSTATAFNDDLWVFQRVRYSSRNERANWRAISWEVYSVNV